MIEINLLPNNKRKIHVKNFWIVFYGIILIVIPIWIGMHFVWQKKMTEKNKPHHFLRTIANPQKNAVQQDSLHHFKYIGYIHNANKIWGIILLPNQKSIAISVGSKVGYKSAYVEKITEKTLYINENGKRFLLSFATEAIFEKH